MPPDAISRSSTYFPNIWGNMAARYGSALLAVSLLSACAPDPEPREQRRIRAYLPPRCANVDPADLSLALAALGDFDPGPSTRELVSETEGGAPLQIPPETLAVEASDAIAGWQGYAERNPSKGFDVLLWPTATRCPLSPTDGAYPGPGGGQALGVSPKRQLLLVAGGDSQENALASGSLMVSLGTGRAELVDPEGGLIQRRAHATLTAFGDDLLLAGGDDPLRGGSPAARLLGSAQVFDTETKRFVPSLIEPLEPRARHAALVLEGGSTLLVGGLGPTGEALRTLQVVSPESGRGRLAGLATLEVGRIAPVAFRLDDGRVLVAGGSDAGGAPVGTLEWLSADASAAAHAPVALPARHDRAFVPMPGGGVLAVGGCEDRNPDAGEDCSVCRQGCPPRLGWDGWWVSPEGIPSELPALGVRAPRPRLVHAANAAPWLVASGLLLRFDPWSGRFEPAEPPERLPDPNAAHVQLDAGAFAWVGSDGEVAGMRHDTRDRFAQDLALLGLTRPNNASSPLHLAPDRSPLESASGGPGARYLGVDGLELGFGTVWVTDARFRTLRVRIELSAGPPPIVALGAQRIGSVYCPWPTAAGPASESLLVERRGGITRLVRGGRATECQVEAGLIAFGLQGGGSDPPTSIRDLEVSRELD